MSPTPFAVITQAREELHISHEIHHGRSKVRLRMWFRSQDGSLRPSREGLELHPDSLGEVVAELSKLRLTMRRCA